MFMTDSTLCTTLPCVSLKYNSRLADMRSNIAQPLMYLQRHNQLRNTLTDKQKLRSHAHPQRTNRESVDAAVHLSQSLLAESIMCRSASTTSEPPFVPLYSVAATSLGTEVTFSSSCSTYLQQRAVKCSASSLMQ